jgi:long-subunit acyl-CoA synthetase (AMP-forming)
LPTLFYSTIAADGIFSASNSGSTPKELAAQSTQVSVKVLFCNDETKPTAIAAVANLALSRVLCLNSSSPTLFLTKQEQGRTIFLSTSELSWKCTIHPSTLSNRAICILLSSGATDTPKACRLSPTNMVSEAALAIDANREFYARQGRTNPE